MQFPSTIWQDLDRARKGESAAWTAVVARYRPAVYAFLRSRGRSDADAEDLTQDVFLQFVRGKILAEAHPSRGRFRSLVLAIACNIARHATRDAHAEKRGGGRKPVPLDGLEVPAPEDGAQFDREWVGRMVASALEELEIHRPTYYKALKLALEGQSQDSIARSLGKSTAQVNNHVHRARTWMKKRLKSLVRESCADEAAYREELNHLSRYLEIETS